MTITNAINICDDISSRLADSLGQRKYNLWFDRSAKLEFDTQASLLNLSVPTQFAADWIQRNFKQIILATASDVCGQAITLQLLITPSAFSDQPDQSEASPANGVNNTPTDQATANLRASETSFQKFTPSTTTRAAKTLSKLRHKLEDFIVGPSNELAFTAASKMIDPSLMAGNPLFIHGGCGLGKTHLLQGICRKMIEAHPQAKVEYMTGEQFTNEYLTAIRTNNFDSFRKKMRNLELLAIDDIHFLANKNATQQEFLHCFDAISQSGARVVLASDCHPRQMKNFQEALVSRCICGMVVEVKPPETQTRIKIVQALAKRRNLPLMETVIQVIASRSQGSVREIEGSLTKLQAMASVQQLRAAPNTQHVGFGENLTVASAATPTTIGLNLVQQLFDHEQTGVTRIVRFEHVIDHVTKHLQVPKEQVIGSSRHRHIVLARSLTIYLSRKLTSLSFPEIAHKMERKTHSTIITASQRVEKQLKEDKTVDLPHQMETIKLASLVDQLEQEIRHSK